MTKTLPEYIHAFHAWAAGAKTAVWFEFIPTDQNPADEPSRDLSLAHSLFEVLSGIVSCPVSVRFPLVSEMSDLGAWMREAAVADSARAVPAESSLPRNVRVRLS